MQGAALLSSFLMSIHVYNMPTVSALSSLPQLSHNFPQFSQLALTLPDRNPPPPAPRPAVEGLVAWAGAPAVGRYPSPCHSRSTPLRFPLQSPTSPHCRCACASSQPKLSSAPPYHVPCVLCTPVATRLHHLFCAPFSTPRALPRGHRSPTSGWVEGSWHLQAQYPPPPRLALSRACLSTATLSDRCFSDFFLTKVLMARNVTQRGCVLIVQGKTGWVTAVVPPARGNILLGTATQCCLV